MLVTWRLLPLASRVPSIFSSLALISPRLLLVVKLVDVLTRYFQYVPAAVLYDRAREGLRGWRLRLCLRVRRLHGLLVR